MRASKILTVGAIAGPLLNFGSRIRIAVNMFGNSPGDPICLIKGDNFTFHTSSSSLSSSHSQQLLQQPHSSQILEGTSPQSARSSKSVLLMRLPLFESTELSLLLRVDDVDYPHRQPCEPVNTPQRPT